MKLLFFNGLPEKGLCLFRKPFINCISFVFRINFYVCIRRWKGKKWQLPSPCGYTIKHKWITWKFREFIIIFLKNESVTQDLSLKPRANKRHLSIQKDSWRGRWPKSTHQICHRNFLLPHQCQKTRNWYLICPFLMSAPSDALKCNYTGSSWRATGSQGKRTGILLGAPWESLSMWIKKRSFNSYIT